MCAPMKDNSTGQTGAEWTIREQLVALAEPDYQKFSAKLLPDVCNILGVRLPVLRRLAKSLAPDWENALAAIGSTYFEEIMLQGMLIGAASAGIETILFHVAGFVPKISNWSVCDSFCSSLKITYRHKERVWEFLQDYLASQKEFEVRFAVVMLLGYYIEQDYLERVFDSFNQLEQHGYYADMAVAWAVSVCFVRFPQRTLCYLEGCRLNDFTYNKSLQKITESRRVAPAVKDRIRAMKR